MKAARIALTAFLIGLLLLTGGCQKDANQEASNQENSTPQVQEPADPDLPQKTSEEIQSVIADLNFEELTQDLAKLQRKSSILKKLESHKVASKHYIANIFYGTSEKKMYVFPDQELPETYDPTERVWYTSALEKAPYISEIYLDHNTQQYILTVSSPVQKDGNTVGVVGIDVILGTKGLGTPASEANDTSND